MTEQGEVAVEQVDRDQAATFYRQHLERRGEVPVAAAMRAGAIDDSPLIQAFARHRLAALAAKHQPDAGEVREAALLVTLAEAGIEPDIQELLVAGNPLRGVAPRALRKALRAALATQPGEG